MRVANLFVAALASAMAACGGNVVVDHGASGGGQSGNGGSSANGSANTGTGPGKHQACPMESCNLDVQACVCRGDCRGHRYRTDCSLGSSQKCTCFEDDQMVGICSDDDDSCGSCCSAFFF
jgi:hypothetical protein